VDSGVYYQQDADAYTKLLNYSGCGNTVNANHPVVARQILDSLRSARVQHSMAQRMQHSTACIAQHA
jgi:hypothetical protein